MRLREPLPTQALAVAEHSQKAILILAHPRREQLVLRVRRRRGQVAGAVQRIERAVESGDTDVGPVELLEHDHQIVTITECFRGDASLAVIAVVIAGAPSDCPAGVEYDRSS